MTESIDPARAAYAFANRFVNVLVTLPNGTPLRTAGRCGGMSYSVLDHVTSGRDVPTWPAGLFAPGRVPPDGHLVADHLRARQLDSFRSVSALRFVTWSALPDRDLGPLAGVRTRTRRELPGILRVLAEGRPVVLGMVVARHLLRAGDNHQVVATGVSRGATGPVLTLLDPNSPGREVSLVETPEGWHASNGRLWRGFFRHAYAPRTPPALPSASRRPTVRVGSGAPLALVHVATGRLLVVADGGPALRATGTTTWTPTGGPALLTDGATVSLVTGDRALTVVGTTPVLGSADGTADGWRVVVDGGGPWRQGSRVRLLHTATGALLAGAADALTTSWTPDACTWWTIATTP
ncbi:hypothetical protein [Cellulomonas dongxiuzhuiae]|uniref:hypothetical protein n=1 Tax=Cellulomonas dongxiuzhuiae TaxID=2819979 RepID=UPI001AAFCE04|nr:hypothetical protein [Cellulomonas dongxiuzhuiae]MBO3088058.1 hypothetical protein [Cellulomonas dongxiuzhuiae]